MENVDPYQEDSRERELIHLAFNTPFTYTELKAMSDREIATVQVILDKININKINFPRSR